MARLIGKKAKEIQENRIKIARDFARKYKVIVVLKGARTVISDPEGWSDGPHRNSLLVGDRAGVLKAPSRELQPQRTQRKTERAQRLNALVRSV